MNVELLTVWVGIVLMVVGFMGVWISSIHFSAHVSLLLGIVFAAVFFIGLGMGTSIWAA